MDNSSVGLKRKLEAREINERGQATWYGKKEPVDPNLQTLKADKKREFHKCQHVDLSCLSI